MSTIESSSSQSVTGLFAGPGPTRAALREVDWAATPLGDVALWPEELFCASRVIVGSAAPMFLWWGPDFTQIHNDALISALGGDDPAVGMPAIDCWPERWEVLHGPVARVAQTGELTHLDDIVLPVDGAPTSYWTLSLSALHDDEGRIGGVLAVACDLTQRVAAYDAERRTSDAATANLQVALASNRRIGIAIGIVMAYQRVTDIEAFDLLRESSQRTHRKLREIAEDVVLTGAIPD